MIGVFDLETQALSTDPGPDGRPIGWSLERRHLMGISWGCIWTSDQQMHHYDWLDLERMAAKIESLDLLVSFNGVGFDAPLLAGCLGREIPWPPHCDLMLPIHDALGYRVSLDDMATANLGITKTGYGGHAPQLWRDGKYGALAAYCARDVELTRDLYMLALRGWLLAPDGRRVRYSRDFLRGVTETRQGATKHTQDRHGIGQASNVPQNG